MKTSIFFGLVTLLYCVGTAFAGFGDGRIECRIKDRSGKIVDTFITQQVDDKHSVTAEGLKFLFHYRDSGSYNYLKVDVYVSSSENGQEIMFSTLRVGAAQTLKLFNRVEVYCHSQGSSSKHD